MNTYLKIAIYFIGALLVLFVLQGIHIGLLMFSFVFKIIVTAAIIAVLITLFNKSKQ
jgi:hypothetical protein